MMTTRLIADFDNTLNDALNGAVEAEAALGRMYRAALARVAELEAQLAAQGWRPVTERPVADDVAGCVPATATPVVWEAGRQ